MQFLIGENESSYVFVPPNRLSQSKSMKNGREFTKSEVDLGRKRSHVTTTSTSKINNTITTVINNHSQNKQNATTTKSKNKNSKAMNTNRKFSDYETANLLKPLNDNEQDNRYRIKIFNLVTSEITVYVETTEKNTKTLTPAEKVPPLKDIVIILEEGTILVATYAQDHQRILHRFTINKNEVSYIYLYSI